MHNAEKIDIPIDVYNSPTEFVLVMPLGWVDKASISLRLENNFLTIAWRRVSPSFKETLIPKIQWCFWWPFTKRVELPTNSYFNNIQSELTPENILIITVPKVFMPDELSIKIQ